MIQRARRTRDLVRQHPWDADLLEDLSAVSNMRSLILSRVGICLKELEEPLPAEDETDDNRERCDQVQRGRQIEARKKGRHSKPIGSGDEEREVRLAGVTSGARPTFVPSSGIASDSEGSTSFAAVLRIFFGGSLHPA